MASLTELGRIEIRTRPDRERVILGMSGELDVASVAELRAALDELRAVGWTSIVLDLSELTFIDSTGLSLLLDADRVVRQAGGTFAIADASPVVARLFEVVGLEGHFRRAQVH